MIDLQYHLLTPLHLDHINPTPLPDSMLNRFVRFSSNIDHPVRDEFLQVLLVEGVDRQSSESPGLRTLSNEVGRVDEDDGIDSLSFRK